MSLLCVLRGGVVFVYVFPKRTLLLFINLKRVHVKIQRKANCEKEYEDSLIFNLVKNTVHAWIYFFIVLFICIYV